MVGRLTKLFVTLICTSRYVRLRNTWSVRCAAVQTLLKCETVVQTSEWLLNLLRNLLFGVFRKLLDARANESTENDSSSFLFFFFRLSPFETDQPWRRFLPRVSSSLDNRPARSQIFEVRSSNRESFIAFRRKNRTPCITRRLLYTEWGTIFIYGEVVVGQLRGAAIIQSSRTI